MLHIDYSLIPLSDEDQDAIDLVVARRLEKGEIPHIDKSHHGRLVVLNPDAVQTIHHVPDELRTPLRRTLHSTAEGAIPTPAKKLFRDITDAEDIVHLLIIELESRFVHFQDFLDYIPRLRAQYPDLAIYIVGRIGQLIEKFQESLRSGGATLSLNYPDARGKIEITDPNELDQIVSENQEPPYFSIPFFSQIRMIVAEGQKPVALNLDSLRRLHHQFGHGEAKEIDTGGGKKERVVIVDLPMRLIRDFQFRQDRGLDFHGVLRNGTTILSRNFEKEKLEYRWIPLRSLEGLLRRVPGKEVETILFEEVKTLQVNTFTGHITFLMKQAGDQISLDDVSSVSLRNLPSRGGDQPVDVHFDRVFVNAGGAAYFDRIHKDIVRHFYQRLFLGEEEKRVKIERYTQRVNVGSVGPLAGQTLKLLRRYGLENLIKPESFHYLCDSAPQLPRYEETAARFEEHFRTLVIRLREIASVSTSDSIRINDFIHKMPVVTEWLDRESISLSDVNSSEIEAAYREVKILIGFIDHEFQRNFDIDTQDLTFFKRIENCQTALLITKWLADYKKGAYGPAFPPGTYPDFVFFGAPDDKIENDTTYFFPGLVCSELFNDPANKALYARGDYVFSVFLEEQLALAEHEVRIDTGDYPTLEQIEAFLDAAREKEERRLEELKNSLQNLDLAGSPEYQALLKQEEEAYHEHYREFMLERDQVAQQHLESEKAFQEITFELAPSLELDSDPAPGWLEGDEPDPKTFSADIVSAAQRTFQSMREVLAHRFERISGRLTGRIDHLREYVGVLADLHQAHHLWHTREMADHYNSATSIADRALPERMNAAKRLDAQARDAYHQRVASQANTVRGDLQQHQARVKLRHAKAGKGILVIKSVVKRLAAQAKGLGNAVEPAKLEEEMNRMEAFVRRCDDLTKTLLENGVKMMTDLTRYEQGLLKYRQAGLHMHKLNLELEVLKALEDKRQPEAMPPPSIAGKGSDRERPHGAEQTLTERRQELDRLTTGLQSASSDHDALTEGRTELTQLVEFSGKKRQLEKLAARKLRLHTSVFSLDERMRIMDEELADLPRRVEEKFMPARKELLLQVFIPEAERAIDHGKLAKSFIREISNLPMDQIKSLYLDRAVFRRFSSRQFVTGVHFSTNTQVPHAKSLHNVMPAVNLLGRTLLHNYAKQHPRLADRVKLETHPTKDPAALWEFVQQLSTMDKLRYGYVVIPATTSLDTAVKLMNQKDSLFHGLPRLVLIYVSKFSNSAITGDPKLRENYFKALKHNVIINIDGLTLVDNPAAIAERLLHETLGSTFDTAEVEDEDEETVVAVNTKV